MDGSISWDPPQTAGVVGNMSYHLVVINNNTGQVVVNTTTTLTTYYFPFEFCHVFLGQVTAHVGDIAGETVVQQHRTIGGECLNVFIYIMFYPPCSCKAHDDYEFTRHAVVAQILFCLCYQFKHGFPHLVIIIRKIVTSTSPEHACS